MFDNVSTVMLERRFRLMRKYVRPYMPEHEWLTFLAVGKELAERERLRGSRQHQQMVIEYKNGSTS